MKNHKIFTIFFTIIIWVFPISTRGQIPRSSPAILFEENSEALRMTHSVNYLQSITKNEPFLRDDILEQFGPLLEIKNNQPPRLNQQVFNTKLTLGLMDRNGLFKSADVQENSPWFSFLKEVMTDDTDPDFIEQLLSSLGSTQGNNQFAGTEYQSVALIFDLLNQTQNTPQSSTQIKQELDSILLQSAFNAEDQSEKDRQIQEWRAKLELQKFNEEQFERVNTLITQFREKKKKQVQDLENKKKLENLAQEIELWFGKGQKTLLEAETTLERQNRTN